MLHYSETVKDISLDKKSGSWRTPFCKIDQFQNWPLSHRGTTKKFKKNMCNTFARQCKLWDVGCSLADQVVIQLKRKEVGETFRLVGSWFHRTKGCWNSDEVCGGTIRVRFFVQIYKSEQCPNFNWSNHPPLYPNVCYKLFLWTFNPHPLCSLIDKFLSYWNIWEWGYHGKQLILIKKEEEKTHTLWNTPCCSPNISAIEYAVIIPKRWQRNIDIFGYGLVFLISAVSPWWHLIE